MGAQPVKNSATPRITNSGHRWYAETSSEASGKVSRGIALFCSSEALRTIDRVPAAMVSVNSPTTMIEAKTWIAKCSICCPRPISSVKMKMYIRNCVSGLM